MMKTLKILCGILLVIAVVGCASKTTKTGEFEETFDQDANAGIGARDNSNVGVVDTRPVNVGVRNTYSDTAKVFYFDFNQSILKPEARAALLLHAQELRQSPRSIRLEGHADERGSREYNMALGERRAKAVKDFLSLQGVNSTLIESISYGEERPQSLGGNGSKNRRVQLK